VAAGPVVRAIARFINWPMEVMGEAFKIIGKLGKFLIDGVKGLTKLVSRAAKGALKAVVEAVERIGGKLIRYADELIAKVGGRAAAGAERAVERQVERLGQEGVERLGGHELEQLGRREMQQLGEREASRAAETRAEREAAETAERRSERAATEEAERPIALAEARLIEAAMQAANAPVPVLIAALDALRTRFTWIKRFEAQREGPGYMVFLIASRLPVDYYDPRAIREALEQRYPGQVSSSTVPPPTSKNVGLAGKPHPVSGIPFDERGFPIFDSVAAFDTRIPRDVASIADRPLHFETATAELHDAIRMGQIPRSRFTTEQLEAIEEGAEKIPGFTWHHHQDIGRMQLIPTDVHSKTGHIGGFRMWFGG
jgi:hypothetical protein